MTTYIPVKFPCKLPRIHVGSWLVALAAVTRAATPATMTCLQFLGVAVLTAFVAVAQGKPKLIGDELASDLNGNAVAVRPPKKSLGDGPEPGDVAGSFTVRTLDGEFSYKQGPQQGPLIVHAFTNKSGFLECLWSSESSLSSLVEELPASTQVLFLSLDDSALSDVWWMREQVRRVAAQHRCPARFETSARPQLQCNTLLS